MPLQRTTSRANLLGDGALNQNLGASPIAATQNSKGPETKGGLKRTTSRGNLLGKSESEGPDLMLRRTGSKVSLADLRPASPNHSSSSNSPASPATASPISPPVSPGLPMLHRSRSMNNFDSLKDNMGISEGQKAVESISGKIDLPNLNSPSPMSLSPSVSSADLRPASGQVHSASEGTQDKNNQGSSQPTPRLAVSGTPHEGVTSSAAGSAAPPKPLSGPYSSPVGNPSLTNRFHSPHDDSEVKPGADRVDYFSHNWNEADIAGSWRYVISNRQDMANSARLENASWRMWAKAKNHLKTVDPSKINWLKDYDVTWLYGPLYHEFDAAQPRRSVSETPEKSLISEPELDKTAKPQRLSDHTASHTNPAKPPVSHLKSILKKKSLAQLMLEEVHDLDVNAQHHHAPSQVRSTANYLRHHHYRPMPQGQSRRLVADILNQQYRGHDQSPRHSPSAASPVVSPPRSVSPEPQGPYHPGTIPTSIYSNQGRASSNSNSAVSSRANSQVSVPSRARSLLSINSDSLRSIEGRHVRFNDRVDQCIAVDPEEQETQHPSVFEDHSEEEEEEEEEEDDEDDGGGGLFLGLRRPSVVHPDPQNHIIAALPATCLKHDEEDEGPEEDGGYIISASPSDPAYSSDLASPSSSRRPGFNAHYTPHPVQTYEIVDPEIHPVKFEVHPEEGNESKQTASFG